MINIKYIEKKYAQNLISAIEKNDLVELSNLLEKNINKNETPYFIGIDRRNYQALSVAADLGNFEAVKLLVESGANTNVVGTNGQTPLLMAVKSYHQTKYDIIYYLIENGADIYDTSAFGCILFEACICNDIQIVKYLFENYNLDINMQSKKYKSTKVYNETLLMMTTYRGAVEVCEFLLEHGADKTLKDSDGKTAYDYALEYKSNKVAELLK